LALIPAVFSVVVVEAADWRLIFAGAGCGEIAEGNDGTERIREGSEFRITRRWI